jgi:porphobilinogen synthase
LIDDLIQPLFICEGDAAVPIPSMPGIERQPLNLLLDYIRQIADEGIPAIALFPCISTNQKSPDAHIAHDSHNLIGQAIRLIKSHFPHMGVIADVALDPYTSHGHDGIFINGDVDNDLTLEALSKQALALAQAGVDIVAPSDMMDGRIGYIRMALDHAGYSHVAILAYSAKYASSFYGPFRDALGSKGNLSGKDKKSYQMNPANSREALREVAQDLAEGADMVMVKPGLPYLDIIRNVHQAFSAPIFAYQVSGEYAMIQAAHANGWVDGPATMMESLLAFKRAGASSILTYAALDIARILNQ